MTSNRPTPRPRPNLPQTGEKPYALVVPQQQQHRAQPVGQERFKGDRLSGKMSLRLTVQTATFVASGVVALGSDVSNQTKSIPLIKTALQRDQRLIIPGSSFKGVVRSVYEALTRSCLCKTKAAPNKIPHGYRECRDKKDVCPACHVFGAMGWQGLVQFADAVSSEAFSNIGFMPSLYAPRPQRPAYYRQDKVVGRKFYYHSARAADSGGHGTPIQQANQAFVFTTQLRFMNLSQAELGTLLIVLGQEQQNPIALKVGGGKPIGMGTMTVQVTEIECPENLQNRYAAYDVAEVGCLTGKAQQQFVRTAIEAAHRSLIQAEQMRQLKEILQYPTTRQPVEGMY